MTKPASTPLPHQVYRDAHGGIVSVTEVAHNRVTFYRKGYPFPCIQPVERFLKEFKEVSNDCHPE